MNIWILDDDVSFAYGLKNKLKADDRKIEVFTSTSYFLDFFAKRKKEKKDLPDLILIDVELTDKSGVEIYLELLEKKEEIKDKFIFCSNVSFGRFEEFFERRGLLLPPFVQKSQVDKEIEKIVEKFKPQKSKLEKVKSQNLNIPAPFRQRYLKEAESLLEEFKDFFYTSPLSRKNYPKIQTLTEKVHALSITFNFSKAIIKSEKLLEMLQRKPPPGLMRAKKEIKGILDLFEKAVSLHNN